MTLELIYSLREFNNSFIDFQSFISVNILRRIYLADVLSNTSAIFIHHKGTMNFFIKKILTLKMSDVTIVLLGCVDKANQLVKYAL